MFCIQFVTSPVCSRICSACIRPQPLTSMQASLEWNEVYPYKLVAAWMMILLTFLISCISWVLAKIMTKSSHCFQECNRNSGHRCLYNDFPTSLGWILYFYLHPLLGADEVSAQSWQLITAIHDETDGLMLCKQLSQGYGSTLCHVTSNCYCGDFSSISYIYTYIFLVRYQSSLLCLRGLVLQKTIGIWVWESYWKVVLAWKCSGIWGTCICGLHSRLEEHWSSSMQISCLSIHCQGTANLEGLPAEIDTSIPGSLRIGTKEWEMSDAEGDWEGH
jgi:hypothetical protein